PPPRALPPLPTRRSSDLRRLAPPRQEGSARWTDPQRGHVPESIKLSGQTLNGSRDPADNIDSTISVKTPEERACPGRTQCGQPRSEEHTSELQSQSNLVC